MGDMVYCGRMTRLLATSLVALLLTACGDDSAGPPSETPPEAPAENDPAFAVDRIKAWYLIGNEATPGFGDLEIEVTAPAGTEVVDIWVAGGPGMRLTKIGDNSFGRVIDISELAAGEYEVLLAADGSTTAFASYTIKRSAPLYVLLTTDWDFSEVPDLTLEYMDMLYEAHPNMKTTHFFGPYTFTDPAVTVDRVTALTDWLKNRRDTAGDEIGVHIHPWCHFVEYAGVTCRDAPSVTQTVDASGYSVMGVAYSEAEYTTLLETATDLFVANDLGTPTSYRAGAFVADLSTLRALATAGYAVDSSATNWTRLVEEWEDFVLYEWNMANWSSIGDTSQPYYPSESDILVSGTPALPILEVPFNVTMAGYLEDEEFVEIFDLNWSGDVLTEPIQVNLGYHPATQMAPKIAKITGALNYYEQFLASRGAGPVVYATVSELTKVWKPN